MPRGDTCSTHVEQCGTCGRYYMQAVMRHHAEPCARARFVLAQQARTADGAHTRAAKPRARPLAPPPPLPPLRPDLLALRFRALRARRLSLHPRGLGHARTQEESSRARRARWLRRGRRRRGGADGGGLSCAAARARVPGGRGRRLPGEEHAAHARAARAVAASWLRLGARVSARRRERYRQKGNGSGRGHSRWGRRAASRFPAKRGSSGRATVTPRRRVATAVSLNDHQRARYGGR